MSDSFKQMKTEVVASLRSDADLYFAVRALPIAKPRQSRRDRFEPSRSVQRYRAWADAVRLAAQQHHIGPWPTEPYAGAVAMSAIFFLPIPESWPKARQLAAMDIKAPLPHLFKPDLSNLIKGLEDPLTGLAWADDAQVIEYRPPMEKCYGPLDLAGAHCWIWFLERQSDAEA